jgi:hypothetical protein
MRIEKKKAPTQHNGGKKTIIKVLFNFRAPDPLLPPSLLSVKRALKAMVDGAAPPVEPLFAPAQSVPNAGGAGGDPGADGERIIPRGGHASAGAARLLQPVTACTVCRNESRCWPC